MLYPLLAIILGLVILVYSADVFVDGAAKLSLKFGMSPLLVGMLVVGLGTSAPEVVVSALASLQDSSQLAIGNVVGSNIANIALVLGITAFIIPVTVRSKIIIKELPVLALVTLLSLLFLYDGELLFTESLFLIVVFFFFTVWSIRNGRESSGDILEKEVSADLSIDDAKTSTLLFKVFLGLVLLILSSRALVWGAVEFATSLGVSELVIGLTIVAVGTSLPELASSVVAVRKGEDDIAFGNIIGSNIFNILIVLGIAGVINPASFSTEVFWRDGVTMLSLTLALFVFGYGYKQKNGKITRVEGVLLMLSYVVYTTYLIKAPMDL